MTRPLVAIVGPQRASSSVVKMAERLGTLLVDAGFRLATGGMGGAMAAAARGARRSERWSGCDVIAFEPGWSDGRVDECVDLRLPTGLGRYRNTLLVSCAAAVVGVGGGAGTLSELALAWQEDKPIAVVGDDGWAGALAGRRLDDRRSDRVRACAAAEGVVAFLCDLFPLGCFGDRGDLDWYHGQVPCLHRLHDEQDPPPLDSAHGMQCQLGLSYPVGALQARLRELASKVEEEGRGQRVLVTFDDGYRDVLRLRQFFANNPILQPVLFVPTCVLEPGADPLWFDHFYDAAASVAAAGVPLAELPLSRDAPLRRQLAKMPPDAARAAVDQWARERGVTSRLPEQARYLTVDELNELSRSGWLVAGHGVDHADWTLLNADELASRLERALRAMEMVGSCSWLAYPDGRWDAQVARAARRAGATRLFTIDANPEVRLPDHVHRDLWFPEAPAPC